MINRIKEIYRVKALNNKSQLARQLGMNVRTVTQYVEGENKPSVDFLVNILSAYPDISAEWLMRGEGEMTKTAQGGKTAQPETAFPNILLLLEKTLARNAELEARLAEKELGMGKLIG